MTQVIKLRPFHYLHLMDMNTNTVSLVTGPAKITCLENHKVVLPPTKMIFVAPRCYVVVTNPVRRITDPKSGESVVEFEGGQAKLRHGEQEIRHAQDPFPLYEGEICGPVLPLEVVQENAALVLTAKRSFFDIYGNVERRAGEQWLFKGPNTYYPQVEVEVTRTQLAVILKPDTALLVEATLDCLDYESNPRKVGEKWLVRGRGAYLPSLTEHVVSTVKSYTLTDTKAIWVTTTVNGKDGLGIPRKAGEEWLITKEDTRTYVPGVHETVTARVSLSVLEPSQYCILLDPYDETTGLPRLGESKLVRGPKSFFLKPGEAVESNWIKQVEILSVSDSMQLEATQDFTDEDGVQRKAGEEWTIYGPRAFCNIPEVKPIAKVSAKLAVESLGLYVFQPGYIFLFMLVSGFYLFSRLVASLWAPTEDVPLVAEL
eukprot:TRINITY_DN3121_c0_g1_i1.p1 TRINITY_DN3121_c0_g1~~TRINITY_DN3121_c0_g1_i1.p1  ORF type:complete len:429 (-),score=58.84 TRINITY_DN3121_c0_g1_i1:23-1309(-)